MAALNQQVTRRTFSLLLPSVALLSQTSQGQEILVPDRLVRDGEVWKADSLSMKMGYVQGFLDAAASAYANVEQTVNKLKSLSAEDRATLAGDKALWDYARIPFPDLLREMDSFYAIPQNSAIKWNRALSYVRGKLRGKSQDELAKELQIERKLATTSPETK